MDPTDPEIDNFLARYAASLATFDATASAALWATPGMMVDDVFAGVLEDRASMARGLEQSYPLYRALGLAAVDHECLDVVALTDRIRLVTVRWLFRDDAGELLTDSTAHYVLRRDDDGYHACVCVQADDREKLAALAADRGVDLTDFVPEDPQS